MNVLLDTQALIWALTDSDNLTAKARSWIQEADTVYVSPINFYETAIKVAIGRDTGIQWPIQRIIQEALLSNFTWLPLSGRHIEAYTQLPFYENHRDPFDRIILAMALSDDLAVISSDHNFPRYNHLIRILWE
ncbi:MULTISPECIES: type II toxin-antitoxin system VapC family toxin [unclassified Spirosoma]|uniref:type II toxin-antitoxin system VapC family toxin n=1 Tax=unclassified Spirosoma TaxID=2621999 RepID=UPI0009638FF5|nr:MULTISPECIES: type II toxin-antitoxin system VapC family toxin [unclassified Spirosoma]MBN8826803.1 type II toxin-antitoxin system VapC family toxin [Spirosoma sp.]OJW73625.1 MAG: hypothetical protein BGO59_19755 [Spirosoma sp. 48-14]